MGYRSWGFAASVCVSDKEGSLKVEFFELDGDFRKTLILAILFDRWRIFFSLRTPRRKESQVDKGRKGGWVCKLGTEK